MKSQYLRSADVRQQLPTSDGMAVNLTVKAIRDGFPDWDLGFVTAAGRGLAATPMSDRRPRETSGRSRTSRGDTTIYVREIRASNRRGEDA